MNSPPGASLGLFFMLLGFLFLSLNVNGLGTSNRVELSDLAKQLGGGVGCMAFKKNDGCGREDGWKEGCCLSAMEKEIDNKQTDIQTEALQGVIPLQAPGKKNLEISGAPADELVVVIGELLWTTPISGTNGGTSTVPPPSKKAGIAKAQAQASYVAVQLVGFKLNQERGNFYAINTRSTEETWTIQALPKAISPYVAWYKEWTGYPVQRNGQKKKRDAQ
ncbi:hypothetical protein NEUTE1DRAFT_109283 [Neurospora tetrasperma FGSC 2508]|uniref:Uncharacterized protein n=1 Tax=Neurospora tetrasperma (strain FGSC 2508 / ATCC MYA-4615 / P0657) TaxID=510951 RepID=F8MIL0_NEUT8|nr:uncharacterized protein NEUTE1DRAFT_109283 [Neurospora tetrasperma FGSC 2508]EGO59811.1 hypothetical protein NEUTE1DRAFT_109283 [Neurospora tetrasperma FGSC 2508]EGZ73959.1 hypothetical protein NEUTE2DRAFT_62671 [Neurospora tetrasperma FGSC 2509]